MAAASSSITEPLYTATQMRALDQWAITECGIPSLELMERAGAGVAAAVMDLEPTGPVRIVCGKGNNGGDGLVAARLLVEAGIEAEAPLLGDGLSLVGSSVVVDAILGTGFGPPRPPVDSAIEAINSADCPVIAVDVPSGVDASTGAVAGACVRADITVTFHAPKLGLWIHPGKAFAGRVEVVDIGIPIDDPPPSELVPNAGLILPDILGLVPRRSGDSNKFSSGSVLVVGGSTGLTGAICLACDAAMRAGAGWVRAAVPASLNLVFEQKLTEVMTIPLDDRDGALAGDVTPVLEAAERAGSVVLGPGLGRADGSFELARELVAKLDLPLLIDADGLNALAGRLELVAERSAPTVLTPHAGELARLLGKESSEVSAERLASAREAADGAQAIVILKGDDSLVVEPDGRLGVSPGGSPGLATAGTGDVLSGVIGSFLAKGLAPFEASCAGVYAHAQAGWIASTDLGADSVIASDVISALPAALQRPAGNEVEGPSA